jgi:nitrite reductase (NADH) small subunit
MTADRRQVRVAAEDEVREGAGTVVKVDDVAIALFRVEGQCYAISNVCPHRGGPLGEGDLEGSVVHCPWHGWSWDVRSGINVRQPKLKVECFPVSVSGGEVFVDIAPRGDVPVSDS